MTRQTTRRLLLLSVLTAALLPGAHHEEATLSAAESAELTGILEDTQLEVLAKTAGLTDEQWNYKPGPNRWSAGEIVEHLMLVEQANLAAIEHSGKTAEGWAEQTAGKDAMLDEVLPDRSQKFTAPDAMQPKGEISRGDLIASFLAERAKSIEMVSDQETPWKSLIVEGLPVGPLGAQQVIRLLGRHTERHLKQVDEVLADAEFPR